jgi:6-phosphogluconolactonase (cycloisomerase 2 family)
LEKPNVAAVYAPFMIFVLVHILQIVLGSYTDKNAGLEFYLLDVNKKQVQKAYEIRQPNASFFCFSKSKEFLFVVSEKGDENSSLSAYKRLPNGKYTLINSYPTLGNDPCYVTYREGSQTIYVANYSGGSVSVFDFSDHALRPVKQLIKYHGKSVVTNRQEASHAHKVVISPDQKYVFITDLGADRIYQHRILADGTLFKNYKSYHIEPGSGPRHLSFHPNGKFAYLINELSGKVDVFLYQNELLERVQTILSDDSNFMSKASAHIEISPDWNWLVVSNRMTKNELVVYKILPSGQLIFNKSYPVAKMPRNFAFDPSGKYLFVGSQTEHKVVTYQFDPKTGTITPFNLEWNVHAPVAIQAF